MRGPFHGAPEHGKPSLTKTERGNYYCEDDLGEKGYQGSPKRLSVTDEEAEILKGLVRELRVLEIGTGLGVSTRAMAESAREIVSVDIDSWTHEFTFPSNVRLMRNVPLEAFDLAFIDGSHKYGYVLADINIVDAPILVLHDCFIEDVKRAIRVSGIEETHKFNTACDMRMFKK